MVFLVCSKVLAGVSVWIVALRFLKLGLLAYSVILVGTFDGLRV